MSSVQDVARKVADYANFRGRTNLSDSLSFTKKAAIIREKENATLMHEELFVPGTVYYLKRNWDGRTSSSKESKANEYFTLWKWQPGQNFQTILLSSNLISDHKCESHYYALRDVIKGLPGSSSD
ncbi:hypothetical protein RDABS01_017813, partial [Bienertia sinuspersici]